MTDFEKFKKFFDNIGIEYEVNGDCLYLENFAVRGGQLIVVDFYDDGKFQCFSPYPYRASDLEMVAKQPQQEDRFRIIELDVEKEMNEYLR